MSLARFGQADWDGVAMRLAAGEGGFRSRSDLAAWLVQPGNVEKLDERYGAEKWGLGEALTMATGGGGRRAKKKLEKAEMVEMRNGIETVEGGKVPLRGDFAARIEARVAKYESGFEGITPNDLAMIQSMASTEISIEELNVLLQGEYLAENPNADRIQKLAAALANQNKNLVDIQVRLGIDKATRDKAKESDSDVEQVFGIIDEAAEYMKRHSMVVMHCGIMIGRYVTDFEEFSALLRTRCPRCGQEFETVKVPDAEDLRALEPEHVAPEEAKYLTRWREEE